MEGDEVEIGGANDRVDDEELSQELTEKLLHFQDITNIDDLDQCKNILRQHAWNVESAVQSTFVDGTVPAQQISAVPTVQSNTSLRRRNVGTISSLLPLRNASRTSLYEARRSVHMHQPRGFFGWGYYILASPFHFTWSALFGIVRFFIRLFIPDPRMRVVNPLGDVQDFIKEYEELYGTSHPIFFQGTYAESQNESRKRMQFLLVYLHGPDHADTHDFCNNTLSNNDVIELVQRNFVFWACSVEKPEGFRVSRALRENTHPFMAVVCQFQGRMTVVGRLEGPLTPQEFMEQVSGIIERYEPSLIAARVDRAERDMTQQIRNEQDEAYQRSLMQDKEKEEKKRQEEELKLKVEKEIEEKQIKKREDEERYERKKQACKEVMANEPDISETDALKLLIKLPDGSRLTRVFLSSQPVKVIHDFVFSQDNAPRQFQVITNFPRKIIPGCSTSEIIAMEKDRTANNTKTKIVDCDSVTDNDNNQEETLNISNGISIAEAGLKSSEMLFVQAIEDTDDEDSATER